MDRRPLSLRTMMLCVGIAALVGGCGGSKDRAKPEAPRIPTQAQESAAGAKPVTVDRPQYLARLKDANDAHDQRLARLHPPAGAEAPSPKEAAKLLAGFGDSLKQLSADLARFRPRDADAAAAHEKLISTFTSSAALLDANLDTIEKDGVEALRRGALKQQTETLSRALNAATAALVHAGWAPKDLEFDA